MRWCLTCDGRYEERRRVCPRDGDVLIAEGKETPETGRVLHGTYRLGRLIGEGGMGQVYEAIRVDSGEPVAVKLLKPGLGDKRVERRFALEAEALAAIEHPGMVKILDFRRTPEGTTFMVMERLLGPTFTQLRRAGKLASPERVVALMKEASEAVAAAHRAGIVHRDLKPSNLLLHRVGKDRSIVKVLDFGIAKFLDRAGDGLTATGELIGTVLYMAPEQSGSGVVTPAADVYSLGAILFEALAGRLPFAARSALELMWLQASAPTPALSTFRPDVTAELDAIVARCLAKKPEGRYADAGELSRALESLPAAASRGERLSSTTTLRVNPALWVGSVLDHRYELNEWIAPGRFGSHVYLATHLHTGASVAVRLWRTGKGAVRDLLIEAFRNEARAMSVRHPSLISILDLGFTDDGIYLVTEYIESDSLRALLDKRGTLPRDLAALLVSGAADALGALHAHSMVSGGLSPETIRVVGSLDRPTKLLLSPLGLTSLKQVQALVETLGPDAGGEEAVEYLAPEQRAGAAPDARSDLYSLGLILLEMLGGRAAESKRPGSTTAATRAVRAAAPGGGRKRDVAGRFEGLPREWEQFFLRALARDPAERFQTAAEFAAELPRM